MLNYYNYDNDVSNQEMAMELLLLLFLDFESVL